MTSPQDIVRLPYDESLSLAGVTYVQHNLGRILGGRATPSDSHLRRIVASVAVDLALRRWFDRERIPYSLLDDEPFTRPEWPRLSLGGRRLILVTSLITSRRAIQRIHRDPRRALDAPAAVSADDLEAGGLSEGDLLTFALLLGLETRSLADLERALAAGHPIHLIAFPPSPAWAHPPHGGDLGSLALASSSARQEIVIHGVLPGHAPWTACVALDPSSAFRSPPLHSVTALLSSALPQGPIVASAESRPSRWEIHPGDWRNLWVYGIEILVLGWKTVHEFRTGSAPPSPSRHASLGIRPPQGSRLLEARRLRPLAALADRLRQS